MAEERHRSQKHDITSGTVLILFLRLVVCAQLIDGASRMSSISRSRSGSLLHRTRFSVRITRHHISSPRPWYGGGWNTYATSGYIYGYHQYSYSRPYRDNPKAEPTICYNTYDNLMENGTAYEWFICPNVTQGSEYHYCCGEEDRQYCCRFWDDTPKTIGVAAGIIAFTILFIAVIFKCCIHKPSGKRPFFQRKLSSSRFSRSYHAPGVHYSVASTVPSPRDEPMYGARATPAIEPLYPPQPQAPSYDPPPYPVQPAYPTAPTSPSYPNCPTGYSSNSEMQPGWHAGPHMGPNQDSSANLPYPVVPSNPGYGPTTQSSPHDDLQHPAPSFNQPPPPGFVVQPGVGYPVSPLPHYQSTN